MAEDLPEPTPARDARIVRTQRQLRDAALTLAAHSPIDNISVAELTRQAGINRATFYKHADSPLQVLSEALVADLDALRHSFLGDAVNPGTDFTELWRQAAIQTADHVQRFAAVYEQGFAPEASGALEGLLSNHIAASMAALFRERPQLLPAHRKRDAEVVMAMQAAYLGKGLAGILRAWFNAGHRDAALYIEAVLGALPQWMLNAAADRPASGAPASIASPKRTRSSRPRADI